MYWSAYNPTDEDVQMPIVPDGSMDIIWLNGNIFLSGLMESARVISIAPKDRFFGIQFEPYALALLLDEDISKFDENDDTPWWRTLGSCGELKPKYPNAPEEQMALLEAEGFSFVKKGKKCVYWVLSK